MSVQDLGDTVGIMSEPPRIDIRNLSIKCGQCDTYQTLAHYSRREGWNIYTYECEDQVCDPAVTRTLLEVPEPLDSFARRDPAWRGGKRHAGGEAHAEEDGDSTEVATGAAADAGTDRGSESGSGGGPDGGSDGGLQVFEYDPFGREE